MKPVTYALKAHEFEAAADLLRRMHESLERGAARLAGDEYRTVMLDCQMLRRIEDDYRLRSLAHDVAPVPPPPPVIEKRVVRPTGTLYEWEGGQFTLPVIASRANVSLEALRRRLRAGMTLKQALAGQQRRRR